MLSNLYKVTLAIVLSLSALASHAQGNVTLVKEYWCESTMKLGPDGRPQRYLSKTPQCGIFANPVAHRVTLQIRTSGQDAGMPGGYYVGMVKGYYLVGVYTALPPASWTATRNGEARMQFSMGGDGLWLDYVGGLMEPAWEQRPLGAQATLVLVDGKDICSLANSANSNEGGKPMASTYELYAGYGVVTPMEEQQAQFMATNADPRKPRPSDDPVYMHRMYAQRDMKHNNKFFKVTELTCPSTDLYVPDYGAGGS